MILDLDTRSKKYPKFSEWTLKFGNNSASIPVLFFYDTFNIDGALTASRARRPHDKEIAFGQL